MLLNQALVKCQQALQVATWANAEVILVRDLIRAILIARQLMFLDRYQLMLAFLSDEQSVGERMLIDRLLYGARRSLLLIED